MRQNQITLSRTQGSNGLVVTKDDTKAKRKREKKKAKKALQAQGKEETANAATKSDDRQAEKPKETVAQYCFRCGSESHQVRGCNKVGDLKCEYHPNHTSHLTKACSKTRLQKGLPLHPFIAAKRIASDSGA